MSDAARWRRHEPGARQLYLAAWRWHFYAGIVVVPFLMLLSCTGLVMLLAPPLDAWRNADRHVVAAPSDQTPLPASRILELVGAAHPDSRMVTYLPPATADRTARVAVTRSGPGHGSDHGGHGAPSTLTVYVDPYDGRELGVEDPTSTLYAWAKGLHGTLLLGQIGDVVVEIVAGFAVLLLLSGLYLAWPRDGRSWRTRLRPGLPRYRDRAGWRDLHGAIGVWLALPLSFFLISGLAWTGVWGGRIVQAWSSIPAAELEAPASERRHQSLNRVPLNEMPWALEQTPLPLANPRHSAAPRPPGDAFAEADPAAELDIDGIVARAQSLGFTRFRVQIPSGPHDPWTVSASTMSGDVQDPRQDRTVHLDAHGRVLADLGFTDYPAMGKAMAAGIPLHQGDLGPWNMLANAAFCVAVLMLCLAAVRSWWRRRPAGAGRLVPPPAPRDLAAWKTVLVVMLLASALVPLSALALITVMVLDVLFVAPTTSMRRLLK